MNEPIRDPGTEAVNKILYDLETAAWSPAEVARQARRVRAHIITLRRLARRSAPYGPMCMDPLLCAETGNCPRDPNCAD